MTTPVPHLVLGIETSCDDTAAAIVGHDGHVFASDTVSQFEIHSQYGGVYPELASRAHVEAILPVVDRVLKVADFDPRSLKAIGVTRGPGLIGSLMVGLATAQALSISWGVPLYGVNHLRGHIRSVDLEEKRLLLPAILLLVSGGHTLLAHLCDERTINLLGSTRDDSVGEAYDKVARMLDLGMPGGPIVDKKARLGRGCYPFPRPMLDNGYEFSFSGLKASVARFIELGSGFRIEDVAASFVEACMDVLIAKCDRAICRYNPNSLVVVGGVSASPQLRERALSLCNERGIALCLPPMKWATDNAAMIALATWDYIDIGKSFPAEPLPNLSLMSY